MPIEATGPGKVAPHLGISRACCQDIARDLRSDVLIVWRWSFRGPANSREQARTTLLSTHRPEVVVVLERFTRAHWLSLVRPGMPQRERERNERCGQA